MSVKNTKSQKTTSQKVNSQKKASHIKETPKKNTSSKKQTTQNKTAKKQSTPQVSEEQVVQMAQEMTQSMNSKVSDLEFIKSNLEQKLKEISAKVERYESKQNTNHNNNKNKVSTQKSPGKQLGKTISTVESDVASIMEQIITDLKPLGKSSSKNNNSYMKLIESFEMKINDEIKELNKKNLTHKQIDTIIKRLRKETQQFITSIQKEITALSSNFTKKQDSQSSTTNELFDEIYNTKNHLERLIKKKANSKELKSIIEPISNRVDNAMSAISKIGEYDSKEFKNIKEELEQSVSTIKQQLHEIEREENKKVSKQSYQSSLNKLQNEIARILEDLKTSKLSEKDAQKHIENLEISQTQIQHEIKNLVSKESKDVSKEYIAHQINQIEHQISNAFKAIEQSTSLENKEFKSLKKKLNDKFNIVASNFDDLHKKYSNAVTLTSFNEHKNILKQEVSAMLSTLKETNSNEKTIVKEINNLKRIEDSLNTHILKVDNTLLSKVETHELNSFEKSINSKLKDSLKKIDSLKNDENNNLAHIKSKINTRIKNIQKTIDRFNTNHGRNELIIQSEIQSINSTINEIITTLKRASKKESKNEEFIKQLEENDSLQVSKIQKLQEQFNSYYTKKQINVALESINSQYTSLKNELNMQSQEESQHLTTLEHALQEQKKGIEAQIIHINSTNHKTFATKNYLSNQVKKLKELEDVHNKTQEEYTTSINKQLKEKQNEFYYKVEALRISLKQLYESSSHFLTKSQFEQELKQINTLINALKKIERVDTYSIDKKLENLANTFSKEIVHAFKDINSKSSKESVEKIKHNLQTKLKKASTEIEKTQELIANESEKRINNLAQENKKLLNIEKALNLKIESIQENILKHYYTKEEINEFKTQVASELNKLHSIHDSSVDELKNELNSIHKNSLKSYKQLSRLYKKVRSDEEVMSTHQEIKDINAAMQETLKHSKTQLLKKTTTQKNELAQEIKALMNTKSENKKQVDKLSRDIQKTYSKDQIDAALTDVVDEVERLKLHEQNEEKKLLNELKSVEKHTSIDYLKKHLTKQIESKLQEIKDEQFREIEELKQLQVSNQAIDKSEHYLEEREEEVEQKIQAQIESLNRAKEEWETFFSNITKEIEEDENSLKKVIGSIETIKTKQSSMQKELKTLEQSQTSLKEYIVEKYNLVVDAFHSMKQEYQTYFKELKKEQEESLAQKFNNYYQQVVEYKKELDKTQSIIDEHIDSKTHSIYEEFEMSMNNYSNKYNEKLKVLEQELESHINKVQSDELKFSESMREYIKKLNNKIDEINGLETNFSSLVKDAKEEIDNHVDNYIEIRTHKFLERESELLSTYQEKIQNLHTHLDQRLDTIDAKFVEKNITSIKSKIKEEVELVNSKIQESRTLRQENIHFQEQVEEKLLDTISSLEDKRSQIQDEMSELSSQTKDEFENFNQRATELELNINTKVEERMTQFEQHLNRRYLETEEKIASVKQIFIDEVEGLMRDLGEDVHHKKEEVDKFVKEVLVKEVKALMHDFGKDIHDKKQEISEFMQTTLGVNSFSEEINNLRDKIAQLESQEQGLSATMTLAGENNNQSNNNSSPDIINSLYREINELQSRIEANSTAIALNSISNKNNNSRNNNSSQEQELYSVVQQLNDEVYNLRLNYQNLQSQIEANNASETLRNSNISTRQIPIGKIDTQTFSEEQNSIQQTPSSSVSSPSAPPQASAQSSSISKQSLLERIKNTIYHLTHASNKVECSDSLNKEDSESIKADIQDKIQLLNKNHDDIEKSISSESDNSSDENSNISYKELIRYNSKIQKEIQNIVSTLKQVIGDENNAKDEFKTLQELEKKIEENQLNLQDQVNNSPSKEDIDTQVKSIYAKIEELLTTISQFKEKESSDVTSINFIIKSNVEQVKNLFFELQDRVKEDKTSIEEHIARLDKLNAEIIQTLKRASGKEKSLEQVLDMLEHKEEEDSSHISQLEQNQQELLSKMNSIQIQVAQLESRVEASSVYETFKNLHEQKINQLYKNQQKIALELKKVFVDLRNSLYDTHSQFYEMKQEFKEIKEDSNLSQTHIKKTSHEIIHSMAQYEKDVIDAIMKLHNKGHTREEIQYILAQKGYPEFYLKMIIDNL